MGDINNIVDYLILSPTPDNEKKTSYLKFLADSKQFNLESFNSNIDKIVTIVKNGTKLNILPESGLCWKIISIFFEHGKSNLLYKKVVEKGILDEYVAFLNKTLDDMLNSGSSKPKVFTLVGLQNSIIENCFISSMDCLSIEVIPTFLQVSTQFLSIPKKLKLVKDLILNLIAQQQQQLQSQQQQPQLQNFLTLIEELNKRLSIPYQSFCDLIKNDDKTFFRNILGENMFSMAIVCQELFKIYESGINQKVAALLNVNPTFRHIIIEYPQVYNYINFKSPLEKSLEALLINFKDYIQFFKKDEFDPESKNSRGGKLFKYYVKVCQFFFEKFIQHSDSNLLSLSVQTIVDILIELPPNRSITNQANIDLIIEDSKQFIVCMLEQLFQIDINDQRWVDKIIGIILSNSFNSFNNYNGGGNSSSSSSKNQQQQQLGEFKLVLLIFENLPNLNFSESTLIELFKFGVNCFVNFIPEIYQSPWFHQNVLYSFHNLIISSKITQSTEFYSLLISSLYYSNPITQNFLIEIWFQIISYSSEYFQNWNLTLIIKTLLKFNNRYEITDFINSLTILLKRVFKILDSNQKEIVFHHLVMDILVKDSLIGNQDIITSIPISIGIFFTIIDDVDNTQLSHSLNQNIQSKVIPFLISKLNQPNIFSTPNLMENLLLILSKIKTIESNEIIQLLNQMIILILGSISENTELSSLFGSKKSLIVSYSLEILSNNVNSFTPIQLKQVLEICSNLSSSSSNCKFSMCKLMTSIGSSTQANQYLFKLDQGTVISSFKSIYQNLFKSPSLILYMYIQKSLKSFQQQQQQQPLQQQIQNCSIIIQQLNQIIPPEEMNRVKNYLQSIPQPLGIIEMPDEERFKEHLNTIKQFDEFKKNNLKERYNQLATTSVINIASVFSIPSVSNGMNGNYFANNNNNNNGVNGLMVSSTGKLYNPNKPIPVGFSEDELYSGLDEIKNGLDRVSKQISFGIKMDKTKLERFRLQYKQTGEKLMEIGDALMLSQQHNSR
ncbi:hypothetical protein RB653_005719 [Dictyostelium firmibasis]|uniref:Uncharacterized protein n=1 Tax=Dictyostelium firmibasis TaxID=79012 RepID=A0AAN7U848_9MYCE